MTLLLQLGWRRYFGSYFKIRIYDINDGEVLDKRFDKVKEYLGSVEDGIYIEPRKQNGCNI